MGSLKGTFDVYDINPYSEYSIRLKSNLTKIKNTGYKVLDAQNNERLDMSIVLAKETLYDKEPFVKLFIDGIPKLRALTLMGFRLFFYACYKANFNKGTTTIATSKFLDFYSMPQTQRGNVTKAVKELIMEDIIALSPKKNVFWINPTLIYKGDRKFINLIPNTDDTSTD